MSDLEQALAYFGAHFDGAAKTNRMGMVLQDEVRRLRAELAQYATGRTMSCASCNEVVKELAQVEAESQVIIDRYNSCKAELAENQKLFDEGTVRYAHVVAELAALKTRMAHDEACSECPLKYDLGRAGEIIKVHESQVIGLESDLASAQTKIEAQSKRISWMAGDALAIHDRADRAEKMASALKADYDTERRRADKAEAELAEFKF